MSSLFKVLKQLFSLHYYSICIVYYILRFIHHTDIHIYKWCSLSLFRYFKYILVLQKKEKRKYQDYCAQIGDIDHYSLYNIPIISLKTESLNPSTYKLFILVFKSSCKIETLPCLDIKLFHLFLNLTFFKIYKTVICNGKKFLPRTVLIKVIFA